MLKLCFVLRILTIALHAVRTFLPVVDLVVIGVVRMTVVVLVIGIPPANEERIFYAKSILAKLF